MSIIFGKDIVEREDGYTELDRRETLTKLKEEDLIFVIPNDYQLQIDIDSEEAYEEFLKRFKDFKRHFQITRLEMHPSKSGLPKRHITIDMVYSMTATERVALQACLGSDHVRELNNIRRIQNDNIYPIALFEKKGFVVPEPVKEPINDVFDGIFID